MKKLIVILFVLVCIYSHGQWNQIGQNIYGENTDDFSGYSVCLSSDGTILAIGAIGNDGNDTNNTLRGHVRIFKNNGGNWYQLGYDIDGESEGDWSGCSVSLNFDGSIIAIGGYRNDGIDSTNTMRGSVKVYENNGGNWVQLGGDIDGEAEGDKSGYSVSLSSNGLIVAIGAPENDGNGPESGHVRIYEYMAGNWIQKGIDIDGENTNDHSGLSVSISADGLSVAIGAPENDGNGTDSGHVRVYEFIGGSWIQVGNDIDGEIANITCGRSVSLSSDGMNVAIGANYSNGGGTCTGSVRVFKKIAGIWTQLGNTINGESTFDYSGSSVSINANGTIVAIGAPYNDGNGIESGHVRIFGYIGGDWVQIDNDIDGEIAYDNSGWSINLNSDGSIVAIGAYHNDENGNQSGNVRVYSNLFVGINDKNENTNISVYPNPTSSTITIQSPTNIQNIKLYNLQGTLLYDGIENVLDLGREAKGIYIVKVTTDRGVVVEKVILE